MDRLRAAGVVETVGELLGGMRVEPASATEPHWVSPPGKPHIRIYDQLEQRSGQWYRVRHGLLTASEMNLVMTPTLKVANNEKVRIHLYELMAQRMTHFVEPAFEGWEMLRGIEEESRARNLYAERVAAVREVGFITNDKWGFKIGFSPDGLVGDDGLIEIKSRRQKFQFQTYVECVAADRIPDDYLLQVQTGLLVAERSWCDFISFSNGLPMAVIRVHADPQVQSAIEVAAADFEAKMTQKMSDLQEAMKRPMIPTERVVEQEIYT